MIMICYSSVILIGYLHSMKCYNTCRILLSLCLLLLKKNKVIIYHFTIANSKLCFYTQTPPSYPLQLPLTQGESWYFFSKMVSNSTLPLFVEGVLERGREFMDYKLVYKFQNFIWIDKESHLHLQHEKDKI